MTRYADFEDFVVTRRGALLRTAYLLTGNITTPRTSCSQR